MDKKKKFLQTPSGVALTIIGSCVLLLMLISSIIGAVADTETDVFVILSIVVGAIFLTVLLLGIKMFCNVVVIYEERIVVKGLFGTLNECKIENIKAVYKKEFWKEGVFYILIDDRKPKNINIFTRKDSYVRFECTNKAERILNEFWHGDVKTLNYEEYLE
jgi:hypothetical protein